ncbi:MAG: oxidoreductase [Armatimonadota bacterium]|nr:MAG: oxidoreductase [Armatimonadota bacterium]
MEYRILGRTGLRVSVIGLGALEVGRPWGIRGEGDTGQPPSEREALQFLNHVLDSGINFIDTAAAYWASEERIGKALSSRRDEFILATKWGEWCDESGSVYDYSPSAMWKFLEESLRKLRTDVIDVYQIHSAPLEVIQRGDALAEMQKARDQGKVRFLGCSCGEQEALAAIECGGFDTIQVSYSLLDLTMEESVLPAALTSGVGVIIKDGLAAGRLTQKVQRLGDEHTELKHRVEVFRDLAGAWGMSLPEMALRFVRANPAVSTIIVGTRSRIHLAENLRAAEGAPLSEEQMATLRRYLSAPHQA